MLKQRFIMAGAFFLLYAGTCGQTGTTGNRMLTLNMEIGHRLIAFGEEKVWAFYRASMKSTPALEVDTEVWAVVTCTPTECTIASVLDKPPTDPSALWVKGRTFGQSRDGSELLLILDPFPLPARRATALATCSERQDSITHKVRVDYERGSTGGELRFRRLVCAGVLQRSPIVWK